MLAPASLASSDLFCFPVLNSEHPHIGSLVNAAAGPQGQGGTSQGYILQSQFYFSSCRPCP